MKTRGGIICILILLIVGMAISPAIGGINEAGTTKKKNL